MRGNQITHNKSHEINLLKTLVIGGMSQKINLTTYRATNLYEWVACVMHLSKLSHCTIIVDLLYCFGNISKRHPVPVFKVLVPLPERPRPDIAPLVDPL